MNFGIEISMALCAITTVMFFVTSCMLYYKLYYKEGFFNLYYIIGDITNGITKNYGQFVLHHRCMIIVPKVFYQNFGNCFSPKLGEELIQWDIYFANY